MEKYLEDVRGRLFKGYVEYIKIFIPDFANVFSVFRGSEFTN